MSLTNCLSKKFQPQEFQGSREYLRSGFGNIQIKNTAMLQGKAWLFLKKPSIHRNTMNYGLLPDRRGKKVWIWLAFDTDSRKIAGAYAGSRQQERHARTLEITNHIERFNLTLRQRAARLGRKTLSFSENMKNHTGAVWNFIHHYNKNIASNLATTP